MAAVGVLTLEMHFPYAHSLKEKRQVVRSLKDRLRKKYNVSVAEVDHQELWQRALIAVVTVGADWDHVEAVLQAVERESATVLGPELVCAIRERLT